MLLLDPSGMRLRRFSGCPTAGLPEPDHKGAILRLTTKSGGRSGARLHRWWQAPVKRPEAGARPWSPHGTALPRKKGPGTLTSLSLPLRVTPLVLEHLHAESSRAASGARSAHLHNRPSMGWDWVCAAQPLPPGDIDGDVPARDGSRSRLRGERNDGDGSTDASPAPQGGDDSERALRHLLHGCLLRRPRWRQAAGVRHL